MKTSIDPAGPGRTPLSTRASDPGARMPAESVWEVDDFRFSTGEVLPRLRLAYTTLGNPSGQPVLILHGTNGSGTSLLASPDFGGELFGPGQVLDAAHHHIVLPDALGCGRSSKPSDGLRMNFPRYNYDDAVRAQYRLLTEHLGLNHLRLLLGHSMGGMHAWLWAQRWPRFMDIVVPMASTPAAMSGRNWMLRRLLIESIQSDPGWMGGNYEEPPHGWRLGSVFFSMATNGGNQALHALAPTHEQADALVRQRIAAPVAGDANDHLYQWDASRDYDPSQGLERIEATLLAINSADDERNPPELGLLDRAVQRVKKGRALLIPSEAQTVGHGTTELARFWKSELAGLLAAAPRKSG